MNYNGTFEHLFFPRSLPTFDDSFSKEVTNE